MEVGNISVEISLVKGQIVTVFHLIEYSPPPRVHIFSTVFSVKLTFDKHEKYKQFITFQAQCCSLI